MSEPIKAIFCDIEDFFKSLYNIHTKKNTDQLQATERSGSSKKHHVFY